MTLHSAGGGEKGGEKEKERAVGVFVESILLHCRGHFLSGFREINYLFGRFGSEEPPAVAFMVSCYVGGSYFKDILDFLASTLMSSKNLIHSVLETICRSLD